MSLFFILLFLGMIGYLVYFNTGKAEEFISSPYNTRQDTFSDRVVRGRLLASGGEVLAQTQTEWDGSEVRYYPYANLFAHVVGYDSNGKSGLESEANFQLLTSHEFFLQQIKNEFHGDKNQGDDVITSLDVTLQSTAYYALGSRRGAVVVMEPRTGRILAMVSKPDFDPNAIASNWSYLVNDENDSSLLNRATNGAYPPGSIFKIVTALDYFRKKGSFENYSFLCEGTITREENTIHCYNSTVHGAENFYTAFANSCNTAFAEIGLDLGAVSLRSTAEDLLFNKKLPLTSYRTSSFPLNRGASTGAVMQTAIGQGNTLVSPIHMCMIVSAIANGGMLMKPTLVDAVQNAEGTVIRTTKAAEYKQLCTEREANLLGKLMEGVVNGGTASALSGRGYTAAGKTGSAEYDESGSSHSWFVGYSNTVDPELAIAVIVEGGGTGSEAAVPIAAQVFDAYYSTTP